MSRRELESFARGLEEVTARLRAYLATTQATRGSSCPTSSDAPRSGEEPL